MGLLKAIRALSDVTAKQWGFCTTKQAARVGVTRGELSALTKQGFLTRELRGVYRLSGSPEIWDFEIYGHWLTLGGEKFAEERVNANVDAVASMHTAAILHGVGDFMPGDVTFSTPTRMETTRANLHLVHCEIPKRDICYINGLPVTTPTRTISDLIQNNYDMSLVENVVRDVLRSNFFRQARLAELLDPVASEHGFKTGAEFAADLVYLASPAPENQLNKVLSFPGVIAELEEWVNSGKLRELAEAGNKSVKQLSYA